MATKIVTKNSSTASAVPTASDLVQGELAVNVADKRLFTEDNAGAIVELGTNPSGNVTFQDNGKAIFGAGSDLQIYHDGSASFISDQGTGHLKLLAGDFRLNSAADDSQMISAVSGAEVNVFHNNALKLSTTATGIEVTGNALVGRSSSLSGQSGSVSANTVVSAHGGLQSHATSAGILEHYNDETLLRSYGANAGSGRLVFKVGGGGGSTDSEAMRIDSSGKLLVGTTSSPSSSDVKQVVSSSTGAFTQYSYNGGGGSVIGAPAASQMAFYTTSGNIGSETYTERMRIDSSGNVGINNSSPVEMLTIGSTSDTSVRAQFLSSTTGANTIQFGDGTGASAYSGYINYTHSDNALAFATGSAERARIDGSGNLLVGGSSFGNAADVANIGSNGAISIGCSTTAQTVRISFGNANGQVGRIMTSGTATIYATSSDQRLKENIVDAPSASDDIDAIQVRSFDWKADGEHQKYGMIAQELQTVAPEAVSGDADSEEMMGVDYSKLVPMLVKEIQSLRNRVAQLEE